MKRLKKYYKLICVILLLISVTIWGFSLWKTNQNELLGNNIYQTAQSDLANFPGLSEKYGNLAFYLRGGTSEYMIVKAGDTLVTGLRTTETETTYYTGGYKYSIDSDEQLVLMGKEEDPVTSAVSQYVKALLSDPTAEYDYYVARGRDLPKWVYPDEQYIRLTRKNVDFIMETIVCDCGQYGEYIRWSIVDELGEPAMFLFISEEAPENTTSGFLSGWGDLDNVEGFFDEQP